MVWAAMTGYATSPAGCRVSRWLSIRLLQKQDGYHSGLLMSVSASQCSVVIVWHTHRREEMEVRISGGQGSEYHMVLANQQILTFASSYHFTSVAFIEGV